jgi:hypothetical protein
VEEMSQFDLSTALEDCIERLQSGGDPEKILQRYPDHISELRPLLQTAAMMRAVNQAIEVPRPAQARSRAEFLRNASQPAHKQAMVWFFSLRVAVTLVIFAVLLLGLLGSGFASASALPGDTFYPVKIAIEQAQINFSADPSQRITLMENFDQRRAEEVNQLKDLGRFVQVNFAGSLVKEINQWVVAGVLLDLTPSQAAQLPAWEGVTVEVAGLSDGNTVKVQDIRPRLLEFTARLQHMTDGVWVADGVQVNLTANTHIDGAPVLGSSLDIVAGRLEDGQLVAITITVQGQKLPNDTNIPVLIFPSRTPEKSEDEGPGPRQATHQPVEPTRPNATPTLDEPGETEIVPTNPPAQSTPTRAATHDDGDGPGNSPTPTATVQPTATRWPTRTSGGEHDGTRTYEKEGDTRTPTPSPQPNP